MLAQTLLLQNQLVHVAAASLAFNVGACVQRGRVARTKGGREEAVDGIRMDEEDREWEVGLVSAVVDALAGDSEEESEDAGELYISFLCSLGDRDRDHDHGRREIKSLTKPTCSTSAPTDCNAGILDSAVALL